MTFRLWRCFCFLPTDLFKSTSLSDPTARPALPDSVAARRGEGVGARRLHGPARRAGCCQQHVRESTKDRLDRHVDILDTIGQVLESITLFQGSASGRENELRGIFGERRRSSKSTLHRHWISSPWQQVAHLVLISQIQYLYVSTCA